MGLVKLLRNAEVFSPEPVGKKDILIVGNQIAVVESDIVVNVPDLEVIDASGLIAVPGFIDTHVHFLGGGGEGGFSTRTAELDPRDCIVNGVTTLVGCLGTDGVTRSLDSLYAKAKALEEFGLTTFIYTGSYRVPPVTFTGSIQRDIVLIDKVIGVGEIAISDHRSSQPTYEEILRIVADARVGGMLSGKPGIVNFHVGAGRKGIEYLFKIVEETEIPITHLYPTHMSRSKRLFEEGLRFCELGGMVDVTALQPFEREEDFSPVDALIMAYENGLIGAVTISSDGQGSLPVFDDMGNMVGFKVGSVGALLHTVKLAVEKGLPIWQVLKTVTINSAKVLKLKRKGKIEKGYDADIILMEDFHVKWVISRGKPLMVEGNVVEPFRVM
ncbi:beta-aspartyl-peptidase [Fervidobacterium thailandense]|uniref:Isoaspartyl dipeptidase n=1 Tax=Fervidobacterium thailandense TaxID=1008305 RepID=A0A1E3G347_9BACT|nr:beta-aspartyl-peptidase [Fervidobacterium thailandense]ODN30098.1 beta-aspartyl-peptidase [Fervidobacterium thailandense]